MTKEEITELLLNIEENQIYDDLMNHPGMKMFMERVQLRVDTLNTIEDVDTVQKLHFRQGQIEVLRWFLTWHEMVKEALITDVEKAEAYTATHRVQPLI